MLGKVRNADKKKAKQKVYQEIRGIDFAKMEMFLLRENKCKGSLGRNILWKHRNLGQSLEVVAESTKSVYSAGCQPVFFTQIVEK